MPIGLERRYGRNDLHFLTFSCYRKLPLLKSPHVRTFFLQALEEIRERYDIKVVGYVVMPNHVHLLLGEPRDRTPSEVLSVLKQKVSRDLRDQKTFPHSARAISESGEVLEHFWQPRFHDFNVYSSHKVKEKLDYMHANPVTRGLVKNPGEWMWSSFSFYEEGRLGLVRIDGVHYVPHSNDLPSLLKPHTKNRRVGHPEESA